MSPTLDRAAINRANALHSTGPRTPEGKARSSRNALCHGLSSRTPLLPSEDLTAYQRHCQAFIDEHCPATPTETQLAQELADTAWRLNRIPALEADLLRRAEHSAGPHSTEEERLAFDVVDLHRTLAMISLHGQRLSRQFQRTLCQLIELQTARMDARARELKKAAALYEVNKHKGLPYDPAGDGFVFSKQEVERHAAFLVRHDMARNVEYFRFNKPQQFAASAAAAS